ncbi:MAG: CPBP family intramembrane metalloprotease [Lentisphaeria bacterium]|nr:CPBP family intramembrane metalloprotease [Lentisphaeria bacterium]
MNSAERKTWLDLSGAILFFGSAGLMLFSPAMFLPHPDVQMIAAILIMPAFFLTTVFITTFLYRRGSIWADLKLTSPGVKDLLPAGLGILIAILFMVLTALKNHFWYDTPPQLLVEYAKDCPSYVFYIILISAGFLAPVSEELVYRCIYFEWCKQNLPDKKILHYLLPSFLFAISHGFVWQSFLLFFLALILQWFQVNGSTTRAILIHAVFNWCSLSLLILVRSGLIQMSE